MSKKKNPAAVALGKMSRKNLTDEESTAIAKAAGKARWKKTTKASRRKVMDAVRSQISPAAASARAQKAWETKRRKALRDESAKKQAS